MRSTYGLRLPRRLVHRSEKTPTMGCTSTPLMGPASHTSPMSSSLTPNRRSSAELCPIWTAQLVCTPAKAMQGAKTLQIAADARGSSGTAGGFRSTIRSSGSGSESAGRSAAMTAPATATAANIPFDRQAVEARDTRTSLPSRKCALSLESAWLMRCLKNMRAL
jgi:hypothetical protein